MSKAILYIMIAESAPIPVSDAEEKDDLELRSEMTIEETESETETLVSTE